MSAHQIQIINTSSELRDHNFVQYSSLPQQSYQQQQQSLRQVPPHSQHPVQNISIKE